MTFFFLSDELPLLNTNQTNSLTLNVYFNSAPEFILSLLNYLYLTPLSYTENLSQLQWRGTPGDEKLLEMERWHVGRRVSGSH